MNIQIPSTISTIHVGMTFDSFHNVKHAIREHWIKTGYSFKVHHSDQKHGIYRVKCKGKDEFNCNALVCCRYVKKKDLYIITNCSDEHSCPIDIHFQGTNAACNSKWISSVISERLHSYTNATPVDVKEWIKLEYGADVPYQTVWKAIEKVKQTSREVDILGCKRIHSLALALSADGSITDFKCSHDGSFETVFIAPMPCMKAFKFIRPFVVIDSCTLTGSHEGSLLCAMAYDSFDEIIILAYSMVYAENLSTFSWFIKNLLHSYPLLNISGSVIATSGNNDLVAAISDIIPASTHAYCIQPTYLGDDIDNIIAKCASTFDKSEFLELMNEIKDINQDTFNYLTRIEASQWANHAFPFPRYGHLKSNIIKLWITNQEKSLEYFDLILYIYDNIMKDFSKQRYTTTILTADYCDKVETQIQRNCQKSQEFEACINSAIEGLVKNQSLERFIVNITSGTCTCGEFFDLGYPCTHACAFILHINENPMKYVSQYYSKEFFHETYRECFQLIDIKNIPILEDAIGSMDAEYFPAKRQLGRPPAKKIKSFTEGPAYKKTCSICGKKGHTKKTCNAIIE